LINERHSPVITTKHKTVTQQKVSGTEGAPACRSSDLDCHPLANHSLLRVTSSELRAVRGELDCHQATREQQKIPEETAISSPSWRIVILEECRLWLVGNLDSGKAGRLVGSPRRRGDRASGNESIESASCARSPRRGAWGGSTKCFHESILRIILMDAPDKDPHWLLLAATTQSGLHREKQRTKPIAKFVT
jgi:hypothetical protein